MKKDNIKRNGIWLMLLFCVLLLGGCSAGETAKQAENTTAEKSNTESMASGNAEEHTLAEGTSGSDGNTAVQSEGITEQEAFGVALSHAGVKEDDVTSKRIEKDYEAGKEVYDVEFYAGNKEYDYEIGVTDGSVVKADFEIDDNPSNDIADNKKQNSSKDNTTKGTKKENSNNGSGDKEITKEEAKKIALAKVPGAKNIEIKKDREDGRVVYEGEIHHKNIEYDFEIDAATGNVLSWEEDRED